MRARLFRYDDTDPDDVQVSDLSEDSYQIEITAGDDPHGADADDNPVESVRVNWAHYPYIEIKLRRDMKVELIDNGLFITMREEPK